MATREPHHLFTYAEYLALERESGVKHEWCAGQVFAMAGGTPEHARLTARVTTALLNAVGARGCEVYSADLKIRILATGLATYPDVAVICGPVTTDADDVHAVTNPVVLVEVLSQSTEAYDRGDKLWHYQQIPSLRAVVLVAQDTRRLELVERDAAGRWQRTIAEEGGSIRLAAVEATLSLDAVYGG